MSASLDRLQERLEGHFSSLANARSDTGFPLFVLEHDLDNEEILHVSSGLRANIHSASTFRRHWLLWAVYATEQGYAYRGDEYWRSFEDATPGWEFSYRDNIYACFKKFQSKYDGVVPTGPWAEHFRIIAWPITHAILPRYLQLHFAKTLYDLRFHILGLQTPTAEQIGRALAANAHPVSTRFEQFLQQHELTGRIVLALFHHDPETGREPIYPPTLSRLVGDLESVRRAREWLNDTRDVVTDYFKGAGGKVRSGRKDARTVDPPGHGQHKDSPNIRPSLMLRRAAEGRWVVTVEVPSLREVSVLNEEAHRFLRRTRCRVSGADDWKAAGWNAAGTRRAVIKRWPPPGWPLLEFEESNALVETCLDADYRMNTGPVWVFKTGRDGIAREVVSKLIRPGNDYIFVSEDSGQLDVTGAGDCSVECEGVVAAFVRIPDYCWEGLRQELGRLGLEVAQTLRIWPAGLPARGWDGEGNSEWLTTEQPCFGIVNDYPVDEYLVSLNGGEVARIRAKRTGDPVFFCLPQLAAGTHTVSVEVRQLDARRRMEEVAPPEGSINLRVRDPHPWRPGTTLQNALSITTDPYDADLEALWEDRVSVAIFGPAGYRIKCAIVLEDAGGGVVCSERLEGPFDLPVSAETCREALERWRGREDVAWAYLESATARITISGEELGEETITFERRPRPVRWVPSRHDGGVHLRLIDDTGEEEDPPFCGEYRMERPLTGNQLEADQFRTHSEVKPPGALFVAERRGHVDSVIVSTGLAGEGLQGLNVKPDVTELPERVVPLSKAIYLLGVWKEAWLAGFLVDVRRNKVVESIETAIYERVCGRDWLRREEQVRKTPRESQAVNRLMQGVGKRCSRFVSALQDLEWSETASVEDLAAVYAQVAVKHGICAQPDPANCALYLAVDPKLLSGRVEAEVAPLIDKVEADPRLLRGARLVVLVHCGDLEGAH